ncbi:hypothetical protein K0U91_10045 [Chryseobacterium chendengshani]|uniref:LA_2272 family surface repeat-containing protein n=1 Tax=Chryseobacterium sp. LJ668 TaxID=2864040 RepID=UPI001C68E0A7|nr:hypothetical protein [Chryseobacterium sp. LJ668]MBW8524340.1 hypothetical protein [Chryseobacterium sp. LJ668]QYK15414.1 hypothetical protein K0U91_10045 [Chryseobacterium sp. LJ668]
MKTKLSIIALCISLIIFGQESLKIKSSLLTVNPQKIIRNTNGFNVGILDDYQKQRINGINFQINPLTLLYPLIPQAISVPTENKSTVTVNGLHLSTGGMMDGKKLNGLGISMYHHSRTTNGFSVNFFNNTSGDLNGFHISGFANSSEKGIGLNMAFLGNDSNDFKGLQISMCNESEKMRGVQIGLVNKTKNLRGLQFGLWNVNEKRKFPIINWNFKSKKNKS